MLVRREWLFEVAEGLEMFVHEARPTDFAPPAVVGSSFLQMQEE